MKTINKAAERCERISDEEANRETFLRVIEQAEEIMAAHSEAAEYDAGFDAGEWSGPEHQRMIDEEIQALANVNGFTYDQVYDELMKRSNEDWRS